MPIPVCVYRTRAYGGSDLSRNGVSVRFDRLCVVNAGGPFDPTRTNCDGAQDGPYDAAPVVVTVNQVGHPIIVPAVATCRHCQWGDVIHRMHPGPHGNEQRFACTNPECTAYGRFIGYKVVDWDPEPGWATFGDSYATTSDGRFADAIDRIAGGHFYGAVPIHDRFEDDRNNPDTMAARIACRAVLAEVPA